jgi:hypothetical protein
MISDLQQLSTRTRDLRKFGLVVGGVFLLSGGWCRATSSGPTSVYRPEEPCRAMNKLSIVKEFWSFLRVKKKFWLIPIVCFQLLLGAILVIGQGSALAPFICSLF